MAQKLYEFETLAARQEEIEEMLRRMYNPGLDQLVRDLQRGYTDLAFPLPPFDGREPRQPVVKEKLTEWEKTLVEKWVNDSHKYQTVDAFARANDTSKSALYRVLAKAGRVNKKTYTQGKGRKRR